MPQCVCVCVYVFLCLFVSICVSVCLCYCVFVFVSVYFLVKILVQSLKKVFFPHKLYPKKCFCVRYGGLTNLLVQCFLTILISLR